jgi:hypothetical protein
VIASLGSSYNWPIISLSTPLCYQLSPLPSNHFHFANAVVSQVCCSPCFWLTGHVHLRALANGTIRNRFGSCVSLVPRAGVAALVALLVTSYKGPGQRASGRLTCGPKILDSINMMACKSSVTSLFLALIHSNSSHRLTAIPRPFMLMHTDSFP